MAEKICTLTELYSYLTQNFTLAEVIAEVEKAHGVVKVFDHSPELMRGMKFRYFVMPLDAKGRPYTKVPKGLQLA